MTPVTPRTVATLALGCKVSQYELEALTELLVKHGFTVVDFNSPADVYIINTCTVTAQSDRKSRQMIRRAVAENPDAVVAVMGCYSQRAQEEVASIEGVSVVLGNSDKSEVIPLILKCLEGGKPSVPIVRVRPLEGERHDSLSLSSARRSRQFVKIEDGCECRCSYCAISLARGPVRSKPREAVLKEIQTLWERGSREIVLTGIEIGSYGKDLGYSGGLGALLCDIVEYTDCKRLRMGSLAPELIGEEFFNYAERAKHILAPHFHISLQSGSDRILGLMRRRYNRRTAIENVTRLASLTDRTMLTADLMVGFPTESDGDFADTFSLVGELSLLNAHVFAYSRRRGTPAADMKGQVAEDVKRARSQMLIAEVERVGNMKLDRTVEEGRELPCILEGYTGGTYEAHTDSYIELRVDARPGLTSRTATVLPLYRDGGVIVARLVSVEEL